METTHIFLFIFIQSIFAFAELEVDDDSVGLQNTLIDKSIENDLAKNSKEISNDWEDLPMDLYSTPSTTLMAQTTQSDKSPEEQLEEMKAMADHITMLVQNEMANLLKYAMSCGKKEETNSRKKRSIETPMDSTKLIMRLLKHIKSNNDYQNIAIDKMMSAQEIADKYGIPFDPDTEILTDLAKVANEQALEMTSILKDACDLKNSSQCNTKKLIKENILKNESHSEEKVYNCDSSEYEFVPLNYDDSNNNHKPSRYNYYNVHPQETQLPQPPLQNTYSPTTQRPNFYDTMLHSAPEYQYCSMEQFPPNQYLDSVIYDPLVIGEEFEETVTSKVILEADQEPGAGTVNHVTTYTISEKTHFKTPELQNLPQQMQYYFFLV